MSEYDLVAIGSGPGGEKSAIQAALLGAKVAVIERSPIPGGASVLTGTVPSKAIRETALVLQQLKSQELRGFAVQTPSQLSASNLLHRHNLISKRRGQRILDEFKRLNIEYITGAASFFDPHSLKVSAAKGSFSLVRGKKFVIASGSRPFHPPDIEFDHKYLLDSDSILTISAMPKSIAIYGAGVIGCEYAAMFSCLGIKVHLINPQADLLTFTDEEISHYLKQVFFKMGIELYLNQRYQEIYAADGKAQVLLTSGEKITADILLYANGRQGNSRGLNLDACGITTNQRSQIDVNDFFQTTVPHIYAVGDIIGFPALASVANEQGRRAAQHAILGRVRPLNIDRIPLGIYTIPEISMIGQTEAELKKSGISYQKGVCYFKELAKNALIGEEEGLLKILFDAGTKEVLGVHIIGHYASDLIHVAQALMHFHGRLDYFLQEPVNFPTLCSAYKVAAINGANQLKSGSQRGTSGYF